ncbi:hypothetical protein JHK87_033705 [Glycine soja]|nr:hypothetical protein JHK87_033705 [Glycine soja]
MDPFNSEDFALLLLEGTDKDATILFSKSCANMFETHHKDFMPNFCDVVENDSQCCEKEAIDLSKDFEEFTPNKHNFCCKSVMGELTLNESESATQTKENDVLFYSSGDLTLVGTVLELKYIHSPKTWKVKISN